MVVVVQVVVPALEAVTGLPSVSPGSSVVAVGLDSLNLVMLASKLGKALENRYQTGGGKAGRQGGVEAATDRSINGGLLAGDGDAGRGGVLELSVLYRLLGSASTVQHLASLLHQHQRQQGGRPRTTAPTHHSKAKPPASSSSSSLDTTPTASSSSSQQRRRRRSSSRMAGGEEEDDDEEAAAAGTPLLLHHRQQQQQQQDASGSASGGGAVAMKVCGMALIH